jgi:hypothetical protein
MRQPPIYTSWLLTCPSAEQARSLGHWLSGWISLDRVLPDPGRTFPNGVERLQVDEHRLGDYFADIRLLPTVPDPACSFRVVFQRRPGAGRFWKDLMVNLLQEIEKAPEAPTITLDQKGDEEPQPTAGARG